MAKYPEKCKKLLNLILEYLTSAKHITVNHADAAKYEYFNFLQTIAKKNVSAFQDFQADETRLD